MPYSLPHQVTSSERSARQSEITTLKTQYQYNATVGRTQNIRSPRSVPTSEAFPALQDNSTGSTIKYNSMLNDGLGKFFSNILFHTFESTRDVANVRHDTLGDLLALEDQLADDPTMENISAYYAGLRSVVTASGTTDKLVEYLDLYQNWSMAGIRGQGAEIYSDEVFANQAVAGPCPTVIKRVSVQLLNEYRGNGFPVTDDIFLDNSPFSLRGDTSLEAMALENRLYVQDFSMIASIPGADPGANSSEKRFVFSPVSLYAVTRDSNPRLLPIAIQMRQNDRDPSHWDPIFVPHMPNAMAEGADEDTADWSWEIAKASVGCASQIYHQHFEHLGLAHYLMESVTMVTRRCLPKSHPLCALLAPHLIGTLAINRFARQTLVNNGGNLDEYISCDIEAFRQASAKSIYETDLLARIPAVDLANREVSGLPYYPYRDDIVLYWDAIHAYVSEFLSVFYTSQSDLDNDLNTSIGGELGDWWKELTTDLDAGTTIGAMKGLKFGSLNSFDDLVNVVTFIIHTASAHHAAVNYPQGHYYSNPLICPATVSRPTPVPGNTNKAYFMEFLPPEHQAMIQLNQMMVLVSFYFTRLGRFESNAFSDTRVNNAISRFQSALQGIRNAVEARNSTLPDSLKYNYLHPDFVPQSTNI